MKKIILILVFFTFGGISLYSTSQSISENLNPNFDFSSLEQFWEIVDTLKSDKDPTTEQWDSLITTPGYATLIGREISRKSFVKILKLSYMPSKSKELEKTLSSDKNSGRVKMMLNTFVKVDDMRDKIKSKVQELKEFPFTEKAVEEALKYLPENKVKEYPPVSFLIWGLGSRGYSPVIITMEDVVEITNDLITTDIQKKIERSGFTKNRMLILGMGHEFFHFYRDKKLEFEFPDYENSDYDIIWTINQIENEGIADQINIRQLFIDSDFLYDTEYPEMIHQEQKEQPKLLQKLDSLFTEIYEKPETKEELGEKIRMMVPRSGHPTGFYMANLIIEKFGKEPLINVVRNPFAFFYLYNKAAKKDGKAPIFSDKSINFIKTLEIKYSKSLK